MIDGISEYPPGFLPMHRAEALAEWFLPGWGHRELKRLFDIGAVPVFALRAPAYGAGALIEVLEDRSEVQPVWSGLLSQTQMGVARFGAGHDSGAYSGWGEWFAYSLAVDHDALAHRFDQLLASTIPSRDTTDRAMWTPPEALAWIASRDMAFVDSLRPQEWETPPKAWAHPLKALIWRLARQDGTWRDLPGSTAPAARQAFDALLAALRRPTKRLAAFIHRDGDWQDAAPAAFAGAKFDPLAVNLDLASGRDLRFDARAVQRLWPVGGQDQPRGRPTEIDRDEVVARAIALKKEWPSISKNKVAISICAGLPVNPTTGKSRDVQGIKRMIAHLWQG